VVWTDYGLKATTPAKDDDRHADLRKFSLGFVCECGVWFRLNNITVLLINKNSNDNPPSVPQKRRVELGEVHKKLFFLFFFWGK
jgi:hypothetical protein